MVADSQWRGELGCLWFEDFGHHRDHVGDVEHVLEEGLYRRWRCMLDAADLDVGKLQIGRVLNRAS
jgi:hypothetical protein